MLSPIWTLSTRGIHSRLFSSLARLTIMHILKLLGVGFALFSLLACSTTSNIPLSVQSPTVQQIIPTAVPKEQVLYQADWSKGLTEWKASAGWKVKNGFIESDLSDTLSMLLPYKITTDTYAIEFTLQIVSVPKHGGQFQLVADRQQGKDGYTADILNLLAPGTHPLSVHALSEVLLDPQEAMEETLPQVRDYEPGGVYRLYRIEVTRSRVVFKIDGHIVSRATGDQTVTLSKGPIHFFSHAAILRISSFRVLTY